MPRKSITKLVNLLSPPVGMDRKDFGHVRAMVSDKLFSIFEVFQKHFPKKKKIKVLSLACGMPDEYIALRAFYEAQGIQIDYTGIDTLHEQNLKVSTYFASIATDFRILTCDGSKIDTVKSALKEAKCLFEEGFDLVVLRQPDVLTPGRNVIFQKMINDVIPFVASKRASVFISTYHSTEKEAVVALLRDKDDYFKPGGGSTFCEASTGMQFSINGRLLELDKYNLIVHCRGQALRHRVEAPKTALKEESKEEAKEVPKEKSKEVPQAAIAESQGYLQVPYEGKADGYVSRLMPMIGSDKNGVPFLQRNADRTHVGLSRFWLRQLPEPSLDELANELGCQKTILKK